MFQEYDVVTNKKEFKQVPKGTMGTILIIYKDQKHFEVEFVDENGTTLDILTVEEYDIEPWRNTP